MLLHFKTLGLLSAGGHQRTDSTHVLASVRQLHRLEMVGETMRAALNQLAAAAPEWLTERIKPQWVERYDHRLENYRLPKGKVAHNAYGLVIAEDGYALLDALELQDAPPALNALNAVLTLRACWEQNFVREAQGVRWLTPCELRPSGERLNSPYDPEACYATRRETAWIGYKVHLTETCDPSGIHLITHVETTSAVIQDVTSTSFVHQALAERNLLPSTHIVDKGYTDAKLLLDSRKEHGIQLLGPLRLNSSWQALAGEGFAAEHFHINWDTKQVTCPQGHKSLTWSLSTKPGALENIYVKFDKRDCAKCEVRMLCTKAATAPRRMVLYPQQLHEALQQGRDFVGTEAWAELYRERAGIEGTLSQAIRVQGLRQTRYRGLAKTSLQNVAIGAAINVTRVVDWLDEKPQAATRHARFTRLVA